MKYRKMTSRRKFPKVIYEMRGVICDLNNQGEMVIITSTINTLVYIKILDNVLISSIENWLGINKVICSGQ